jgi:hypothetical protein
LERLGIEEHVVDHPAEVVRVVGKRHDLVRYGRRQLKKISIRIYLRRMLS